MKKIFALTTIFCLLCANVAVAQDGKKTDARIKIDIDRTIGEVHPHLFGNFAEHLGRMIYGGIYEDGSPLSDKNGYRNDVLEAVKGLNVSILRYPGGNFVSGYNWKDGVGSKAQRPVRPELAWGGVESNQFGTDEFIQYCRMIGAEPYICINAGLGTIDEARQWVEYCNEKRNTYWADQRRKNGHDEPFNVKYWGLGNEIDGPWQMGHKNAEDYSKFALEAAKAMRWSDSSIKLIASGSSNFGSDWINWNQTVLSYLKDHIDYISLHTYVNNHDNDFEKFLANGQNIDKYIDITAGLIKQAQARSRNPRPIYIAYDEWNVWYRAHGDKQLEEVYNFEDALAMGMFFNSFIRRADVVKMANIAQLVNVIAPIMTNKNGYFLQPIYFPLVEFQKQRNNMSLNVLAQSPTYKVDNRPAVGYLDVSSTYNSKDKIVYLNVLNRSKDKNLSTRIDNLEGQLDGSTEIWEMNNPDLKTVHTFGDDKKVRPSIKSTNVKIENNGFNYTFPAHSLTILRLKLK